MTLGDNDDKELWTLLKFKSFSPSIVTPVIPSGLGVMLYPFGAFGPIRGFK
jgi:hypothetical protein